MMLLVHPHIHVIIDGSRACHISNSLPLVLQKMAMQRSSYDRFQCLPLLQQVMPMWDLRQYDEFNGTVDFERKGAMHRNKPVRDYFIFYPVRVPSGDEFLSMHMQKEDHHRRRQIIDDDDDRESSSFPRMQFSHRPKMVCLRAAPKTTNNEMKPPGKKVSLLPNRAMKAKLSAALKPASWPQKKSVQLTPASQVRARQPHKKAAESVKRT